VDRFTIGHPIAQVCGDRIGVRDTRHPQRAPERAASHRLSEACGIVVQVCAPAGTPAGGIGNDVDSTGGGSSIAVSTDRIGIALGATGADDSSSACADVGDRVFTAARDGDDPQQFGGWRTLPATHTRAHRIRATYHP
jgi:hypothetical protein